MERVRAAVLLPVRIAIKDVYDDTCTELLITASLDSGGRGRPRVTYDVTAALNTLGALPCAPPLHFLAWTSHQDVLGPILFTGWSKRACAGHCAYLDLC